MNNKLMKYIASTSPTVKKKYGAGLVLDLGLTRDGRDGLATGQTVTDRRADRAATEGDTAADECTRNADASLMLENLLPLLLPPGCY